MKSELFVRDRRNPLITPADLPFKANAVFNPGVALVDDEVVLLVRIEDRQGISGVHVARSRNGIDNWCVEEHPLLEPGLPEYPYEEWGCEDARVTQIGPRNWIIAYTAYSPYGPAVALAKIGDFVTAIRLGIVKLSSVI